VRDIVANELTAGSIPVIRSNLASPVDGPAPSKHTVSGSNPLEATNIAADGR
jgi:hypothetical protein